MHQLSKISLLLFAIVALGCSDTIHQINCEDADRFNRIEAWASNQTNNHEVGMLVVTDDTTFYQSDYRTQALPPIIKSDLQYLFYNYKIDEVLYSKDFNYSLYRYNHQAGEDLWIDNTWIIKSQDIDKHQTAYEIVSSSDCFLLMEPNDEFELRERFENNN